MYRGKYLAPKRKRRKKLNMFFVALVLLFLGAVGGTMAFLLDTTSRVENTFTPAEVKITINENKTDNQKKNIQIKNTKTDNAVPVYVRATLVIYWKDTIDGVLQTIAPPTGGNVQIGEVQPDWFSIGDIYYYSKALQPDETTSKMLGDITVTIPEGSTAKCYIDVRAEAIQAEPKTAVETAWKDVEVVDGRLSEITSGGA